MDNLVIMKDQQAVTTSTQVAKLFERNHRDVLKAINNLVGGMRKIAHTKQMFVFGEYENKQNHQKYPMYWMNRDGFALAVMGFTGQKALEFKLQYINAFNQMEAKLKQGVSTVKRNTELSPVLQAIYAIADEMKAQELKNKKQQKQIDGLSKQVETANDQVSTMKETIVFTTENWRSWTQHTLNAVSVKAMTEFKTIKKVAYTRTETVGHCKLLTRLNHRRERMLMNGATVTMINDLNCLDVIGDDPKLVEIYCETVRQMAIKYGVKIRK